MANKEHLKILKKEVEAWNVWRDVHPDVLVDLSEANLVKVNLRGANLRGADLREAGLGGANLFKADLSKTKLSDANLIKANLIKANLSDAKLSGANLGEANLIGANLSGANLRRASINGADLSGAVLVRAQVHDAELTGCNVYAISVWDLKGVPKDQSNLVITPREQVAVTVDDLKVAQFVYLLLHNPNIRNVIDTIGKKGVLILGRFGKRLEVLNALRQKLRERGFVPMVFDFERAKSRDFTETVMTLAGMSAFIIADITQPRSVQQELTAAIPNYMIPFVPIIQTGERPYSMFVDLQNRYDKWVLDVLRYANVDQLVRVTDAEIIEPAEKRMRFLLSEKARGLRIRDAANRKKISKR